MDRKAVISTLLIGISGTVVIISGVYLFSRHSTRFSIYLGDKGSLGDAVNGLSAPIISFFSAILVYITFKEQNKANKLQVKANSILQRQWMFDTYIKLFNEIREAFEGINIKYRDPLDYDSDSLNHYGKEALFLFANNKVHSLEGHYSALNKLTLINYELVVLLEDLMSNKFKNDLLLTKIMLYYSTNMQISVERVLARVNEYSTKSDDIVDLINSIERVKGCMEEVQNNFIK